MTPTRWAAIIVLTLSAISASKSYTQSTTSTSAAPSRVVDEVNDAKLTTLSGNTHPLARAEFDRGAVSPQLSMERMLLLLKRSPEQEAALNKLMTEQLDPGSPNYHHWLSPVEFGRQFGPSDSDLTQVTSWLQNHGFEVTAVSQGRVTIEFSGNASQVQAAFHTEIHRYLVEGVEHTANASDPRIPEALAPVVAGIASLNNFFPKPQSVWGGKVKRDLKTGRISPVDPSARRALPLYGFTNNNGNAAEDITPYDFATIYNVLPLWNAGINGTGQTIAISGVSDVDSTDVATFKSTFGLAANPLHVIHNGTDPGYNGGRGENTLDVEWSGALAPRATLILVVSADTQTTGGDVLSDSYIVDHNVAHVMSASYGICEANLGSAGNATYNKIWQQGAAEGMSIFESSGDQGSAGCANHDNPAPNPATTGLQVNGIASSPFVTAVGGTDFAWQTSPLSTYWNSSNAANGASAKRYIPEIPWDSTCTSSFLVSQSVDPDAETFCNDVVLGVNYYFPDLLSIQTGSGGVSAVYPKPSWQTGTGVPNDGRRDLPDVSMFASAGYPDGINGSAYLICDSEQNACNYTDPNQIIYQEVGGTSVSSPTMAGIMALVLQKTGSSQGLANPTFYKLYGKENVSSCNTSSVAGGNSCVFYDITTGTNAVACTPGTANCTVLHSGDSYGVLSGYSSTKGYDLVTGLGSVNVTNLVNAWTSASGGAPAIKLSSTAISFGSETVGHASASQTLTVTNTGTATLDFNGSYFSGANIGDFSKGTHCGSTVAPGASCTITLVFIPSATGARSAVLNITDNAAGGTQTVALSGTGTTSGTPSIRFSPTAVAFGSETVGHTASQTFTITNAGSVTLDFNGSYITGTNAGDFLKSTHCGSTIAPGASCTLTLSFTPGAVGARSAVLNVTDNASGSPQQVPLSGTGVSSGAPAIKFSPTTITFPSEPVGHTSSSQLLLITNVGSGTLNFGGSSIGGTEAADFSKSTQCGSTIPTGDSCTITLTFTPHASGPRAASLNVVDNASGSPQSVPLGGTGQ